MDELNRQKNSFQRTNLAFDNNISMDELNRQKANHLSMRLERCLADIELHLIRERTGDSADKILEKIRKIRDSISDPSIHQFIVSSVIEDSANDFKAELGKELAVIGKIINVSDVPELSRLTVLIEKLKDAVEQPYPCASNEAPSLEESQHVAEDVKQWARDIAEDQRLKLEGKTTRDPVRKPIYSNVGQRKRDNPEKHKDALEYLSHINQKSNCQD